MFRGWKSLNPNLQEDIIQMLPLKNLLATIGALGLMVLLVELYPEPWLEKAIPEYSTSSHGTPPLVMKGGDPYIRALMRTITASEANVSRPYSVIYGGEQIWDLSRHPERCVTIVSGPNAGNCSTAAGRYQFINTTWYDKAQSYHPRPWGFLFWKVYSFEPQYQDKVVYAWLSDPQAWGMNISEQLREGNLDKVLRRLSGTWTSLGYGIENNVMTPHLSRIYQRMLDEELQQAQS